MSDSPYLMPSEAAARLGVDVSTIRRWEDQGHLDAARTVGGHRRYWRSSVERLEDELADTRGRLERAGGAA